MPTAEPAQLVDVEDSPAYRDHLLELLEERRLDGMRIVVDAANGAASGLARRVLASTGADVIAIHDQPDGRNINEGCGATDTTSLAVAVRAHGADLGLALDGDADRLMAVDASGTLVDGDHIIAICALDLLARGGAPRTHRRRDGDDEPRLPAGHGDGGDQGPRDACRRPVRAGSARRRWLLVRRRAERSCDLP